MSPEVNNSMKLSEQVPNLVPRSPLGSLRIQDGGALLFVFVSWSEYQYISHLDKGLDKGFSQ